MVIERLHEGEFLHGSETREVKPRRRVAMTVIVALVFDGAEAGATQSMKFEAQLGFLFVGANVNVRLFADADFVADGQKGVTTSKRL